MTKEEAKEFYPILQAFAEGRVIETRTDPSTLKRKDTPNDWTEMKEIEFWNNTEYRIKPEPIYRPFKNTEECFEEMQKHQPSGWIKRNGYYYNIIAIGVISVTIIGTEGNIARLNYSDLLSHYKFIDGTLVGIKKEEQLWHGQLQIMMVQNGFIGHSLLEERPVSKQTLNVQNFQKVVLRNLLGKSCLEKMDQQNLNKNNYG